ncbi:hypothetical protein, partial [uncultured Thiodictyon sp.]|uniref:hypothetical protein n=1 Tax=uncultured Thiodictyon sp. TaxID=1846217 RepID=UPI0025D2FDF2
MTTHNESAFEDDICAHLAAHGWRYELGDAQRYDRARALFPPDLIAWIEATQPAAWASLTKTHGAATETVLLVLAAVKSRVKMANSPADRTRTMDRKAGAYAGAPVRDGSERIERIAGV